MRNMHWEKSPPTALARSRPYQGVRVRDPVKELLRRKRSLQPHSTKTVPPAVDVATHNNSSSSYTQAIFSSEVGASSLSELSPAGSDAAQQCAGWKASTPATSSSSSVVGLQAAATPWSSSSYNQQERSAAQTLAYTHTPTLPADVYMQTLCPSYTMLTYTHTPLLTNFGTIPVAPAAASLPQMELPDSGLAYLPWAPPLTTISTIPNAGVQFASGPTALPGSPLVHMPMSMSLTTMVPQGGDPQPQVPDLPQHVERLVPDSQAQCLDENEEDVESEPPSLLDKLLEEQKNDGEEDKHAYSGPFFDSDN